MNQLNIEFYGLLAEIAGKEQIQLPIVENTALLREQILNLYPEFSSRKFILAIDNKIVHDTVTLQGASKVSCMPPFAGG